MKYFKVNCPEVDFAEKYLIWNNTMIKTIKKTSFLLNL